MSNLAMPKQAAEVGDGPGALPPERLSWARNWYRTAAVALLSGVLLFFLANLILYPIMILAKPTVKVGTPLDRWGSSKLLQAYPGWREEDIKTLMTEMYKRVGQAFEYEVFTDFRERPFRGKYVNIDSAGFRVSKDQAPWPPNPQAMNVFLFGGSTTFGYGLPDDQTIASYIGECDLADRSRGRLAVYNFGRGSYFSSQERILFQKLLVAGHTPQVAVFIDGLNDFGHANGEPRYAEELRRFVAGEIRSRPLDDLPVFQAARWLRDRWARPSPHKVTDYADPAVQETVVNRWLANKRMIELVASGFGVRTIFVWQPSPMYKYDVRFHPFYNSDNVFGAAVRGRGGYALMENLRAKGKLGPNVLWLADMQQDRRESLYVDAVHYSAGFSREIAAQICGFLNQRGVSPEAGLASTAVALPGK